MSNPFQCSDEEALRAYERSIKPKTYTCSGCGLNEENPQIIVEDPRHCEKTKNRTLLPLRKACT